MSKLDYKRRSRSPMIEEAVSAAWLSLDKAHLRLLSLPSESPHVPATKADLEAALRSFLSLVPTDRKFVSPELLRGLYESVEGLPGFSAGACGLALEALEDYAANLLRMPWRSEFREIREYSGHFKHRISEHLLRPEIFLFAMGYERLPEGTFLFRGPLRKETLIKVARDLSLASMECKIMENIAAGVRCLAPSITYKDILDFRRAHVGGPESAIRSLLYERAKYPRRIYSNSSSLSSSTSSSSSSSFQRKKMIPLTILGLEEESRQRVGLPSERFYELEPTTFEDCETNGKSFNSERFYELLPDVRLLGHERAASKEEEEDEEVSYSSRTNEESGESGHQIGEEKYTRYSKSNGKVSSLSEYSAETESPRNHSASESRSEEKEELSIDQTGAFSDRNSENEYSSNYYIPVAPVGTWACPACTFDNEDTLRICAMCSKSKGPPLSSMD